jgi:RNA polymerase sigma-70 factor (ECF subfamily)
MPDIDIILWGRVKSGSKEAFEILFRKYYPVLCLFSRRFTNDLEISREVMQDLFVYLWEHRADIEINYSLKSYLLSAARFNSMRRIQKERRGDISIDNAPELPTYDTDYLEYAELQEKILDAVSELPDQCKRVFLMSRNRKLKYAEIAQQLGISVKTVEAHISKALRLIQIHLKQHFITFLTITLSGLIG